MAEYRTIVDAIKEEVVHELPLPRSHCRFQYATG